MLKDAGKHKAKGSVLYTVVAVMMIMAWKVISRLYPNKNLKNI